MKSLEVIGIWDHVYLVAGVHNVATTWFIATNYKSITIKSFIKDVIVAKKKKNLRTEIYVVWIDSEYEESDSHDVDEKFEYIHTIGWLVKETKSAYIVAKEISATSTWHRRTTKIPKCAVKHFEICDTELKEVD